MKRSLKKISVFLGGGYRRINHTLTPSPSQLQHETLHLFSYLRLCDIYTEYVYI